MAALMVPFVLKSFLGLYPESRRFLPYWSRGALTEACANTGVAAVADSSAATARALNEIIFVSPVWIDCRPTWDETNWSRFVRRACCPDRELSACSIRRGCLVLDVGRPHARPIKLGFK